MNLGAIPEAKIDILHSRVLDESQEGLKQLKSFKVKRSHS